jgi:tRNA U34 2-thiouridine synthase MnmA/TrmU
MPLRYSAYTCPGHYARRPLTSEPELHRGLDSAKDQSYYLSSIPRTSLARTLFPLGDLQKPYVRELARRANLPTAERAESMGICFVGEKRRFSEFVTQYVPPRPGNIVSWKGETVGTHNGLWTYTIGEGARLGGMKEKWFVARKDIAQNEIVVVPGPCAYSRVDTSPRALTGDAAGRTRCCTRHASSHAISRGSRAQPRRTTVRAACARSCRFATARRPRRASCARMPLRHGRKTRALVPARTRGA